MENELIDLAEQGDAQAMYDLANRYRQRGKPDEVLALFKKCAEKGYVVAEYELGCCYMRGDIVVEKDMNQAVYWLQMANEQGLVDAQYELGYCYMIGGYGIAEDDIKAFKWFKLAAENGCDPAQEFKNLATVQYKIALAYQTGEGKEKDLVRAVAWFQKAVDQGQVDALYELGICYQDGKGVQKDMVQATAYFKKAAEQQHVKALEILESMERKKREEEKIAERRKHTSYTDVFEAVNKGTIKDVRYFIEKECANINAKCRGHGLGEYGFTPLHMAVVNGKTGEIIEFLISAGANVNVKDNSGGTPLHMAVLAGNVESVRILVSAKADVNMKDKDERLTPLHLAAKKGQIEISKILISAGANVNAKASNDSTPLHLAAVHGNVGVARVLVSNGASVNAHTSTRISDGTLVKATPLDFAKVKGHTEVARFLSSVGGQSRM